MGANYNFVPAPPPIFIGRDWALQVMASRSASRARLNPIVVIGPPGIGKTTLVHVFLNDDRLYRRIVWLDADREQNPAAALIDLTRNVLSPHRNWTDAVVIDGAEVLSDEEIHSAAKDLLYGERHRVGLLLVLSRGDRFIGGSERIVLDTLSSVDAVQLVDQLLNKEHRSGFSILEAARLTEGHPLATKVLVELINARPPDSVPDLLAGIVYDLAHQVALPERQLIATLAPRIILANEAILNRLKEDTRRLFDLDGYQFEVVLRELLTDMGCEVEVTHKTRDEGRDLLVWFPTPVGRLLCLVEAKRYRMDRKVGVELVRQLLGTLVDYDAASGMLVTTSSFSKPAHAFQRKHQYRLSLKSYGDVVQWIEGYKEPKKLILPY
jgi:HJR/Mrr/RecB family endonuclease